ncbi:MAG: alpha-L-arabinofuranosidase C-terminal domain-containing protein [Nibricoccus sp.]
MKFFVSCTLSVFLSALAMSAQPSVSIDLDAPGKAISTDLFGIFFEDLNYAADGGLYAELIQNRSFEYRASEQSTWGPFAFWEFIKKGDGDGHVGFGDARPVHANNENYLLLTVIKPGDGVGIGNNGFDQIPVRAGQRYHVSFWAYQAFMGRKWGGGGVDQGKPMPVTVRLESKDGSVLASRKVYVSGRAWTQYAVELIPEKTDEHARFVLLAHEQGGLALDMVSLMPDDTFRGRSNGLRKDLASTIADLRPRFMRFPGGCLVHGPGVRYYYDWKHTVGPLEQRVARRNSWGYHQTMGLGYHEYFQFCEDMGAVPVPVVTAGVCCQHAGDSPGRGQEGLPLEEMPGYIQDVLDLIEWANGPADSKWGAVRAAAGHPAPFGLKYLGVGNEDAITPEFKERFRLIHAALKKKHPEIVVIGTSGPFANGEDFDKGWAFARELRLEMVDEHYYVSPQWFWDNLSRYDAYDRSGPKVYLGEYAAHDEGKRNTLRSAIAEAAYLTSLERNGDIVTLASYAPLLARRGHTQWTPDMIYFNAANVFPSLNYTVQKLFGHHGGDVYVTTEVSGLPARAKLAVSTVRDSKSGDIIVKIVNGAPAEQPVRVLIKGGGSLPSAGAERIIFGGASEDAVNADGEPPAVEPRSESVQVSRDFEYRAPASSLTILRIRSR